MKSGSLKLLEPSGPLLACTEVALPLHVELVDEIFLAVACKTILAPWLDRQDLVDEGWRTKQNKSVIF
jgi:hypothetical protein